jgi:hypothetical protein
LVCLCLLDLVNNDRPPRNYDLTGGPRGRIPGVKVNTYIAIFHFCDCAVCVNSPVLC